ncbi:hypothetical protein [Lactobacillus taiwanensis]|uniref:hypothetical protein n=1 Tax=Lactobacillus taiwanensis TaxID=508451 RepID=UPI0025A55C0E|nr:hypothetical protein [Lactobacillus taiwanensis]
MQEYRNIALLSQDGGVEAYSINSSRGFNTLNPNFLAQYLIKAKLRLTYVVML